MTSPEPKCLVCGTSLAHRDNGSGRHAWRYCGEECRAAAAKAAKTPGEVAYPRRG